MIFDHLLTQNWKLSLSKLLQDHIEENARIGGSRELLLSSNDLKNIAPQWVSHEELKFEGLQTCEGMKVRPEIFTTTNFVYVD